MLKGLALGRKPVLIAVVGLKGRGKTSVAARIVEALKRRGYVVAAIKHVHTKLDFQDRIGSDTHRLAGAGADVVVGLSRDETLILDRAGKLDVSTILEYLTERGVDVVVLEGLKELVCRDPSILKVIVAHDLREARQILNLPCKPSLLLVQSWPDSSKPPSGSRLADPSTLIDELVNLVEDARC